MDEVFLFSWKNVIVESCCSGTFCYIVLIQPSVIIDTLRYFAQILLFRDFTVGNCGWWQLSHLGFVCYWLSILKTGGKCNFPTVSISHCPSL